MQLQVNGANINTLFTPAAPTLDSYALTSDLQSFYATKSSVNNKAPINNPHFTGTVTGITKAMVGLGDVDNTTDLLKPISTATQTVQDLQSNLNSQTFKVKFKADYNTTSNHHTLPHVRVSVWRCS